MILAELGSHDVQNKLVVPMTHTQNSWEQIGVAHFYWGQFAVEDDIVGDAGAENLKALTGDASILDRGRSVLNRLRWHFKEVPIQKEIRDEQVGGIILLLYTHIEKKPFIVVERELMSKPWVGKEPGDYSLPAETREPGETLEDTMVRLFRQELGGINHENVTMMPNPIGFYEIHGEGEEYAHRQILVQARSAFISAQTLHELPLFPTDNETDSMSLVTPLTFLGGYPSRAGMRSVVAHWLVGHHDVYEARASRSNRISKVLFEYPDGVRSEAIL